MAANLSVDGLTLKVQYVNDTDPFSTSIAYLEPARAPAYAFSYHISLVQQIPAIHRLLKAPQKVDECALQIYRAGENGQGDFGTYLDSDLSLAEQPDEVAVLKKEGRKTSLVLRTNLSVRVHTIIEKMLNSTGRELRRALFSLKQIFQDDKDLVHEFVQNDGLTCLIKVGAEADQNYQNYILRALGQVMLYVDGMNGVISHNETIQWLYSLLGSQYRLVVKTALKLLLVFVEYTESNALLLLAAVYMVDKDNGALPWSKLMCILKDKDNNDLELFMYTMSLIIKTLNGVPDEETFYDVVDALEQQQMESVLKRMLTVASKDLTEQCRVYEAMLQQDDSVDESNLTNMKSRPVPRRRITSEEGKVRRRRIASDIMSHGAENRRCSLPPKHYFAEPSTSTILEPNRNVLRSRCVEEMVQNPDTKDTLKISREKVDEPAVELNNNNTSAKLQYAKPTTVQPMNNSPSPINKLPQFDSNRSPASPTSPTVPRSFRGQYSDAKPSAPKTLELSSVQGPGPASVETSIHSYTTNGGTNGCVPMSVINNGCGPSAPSRTSTPLVNGTGVNNHKPTLGAVHSLAEKFQLQNHTPKVPEDQSPPEEPSGSSGTFSAALSLARKCMSKKIENRDPLDLRKESEIQWERAMETLNRPLVINDLDFTELEDSDDCDPLKPQVNKMANGAPPPPPPIGSGPPPLPPGPLSAQSPGGRATSPRPVSPSLSVSQMGKDLKTVKLFWKEAQTQPPPGVLDKKGIFWQKVKPVQIDTERLVHLFETKSNKEAASKKKDEKKTEIRVLDTKRSNAINIGLTKLPPPRAIHTAILKFDSSIMNKECIEKILFNMMPTEEEKEKIVDAQQANPDVPLGSAEQFLLLLSEVPALFPRLKLWLFMLDYSNLEREVAEPLMDLKLAMEELEKCSTFKYVMATLLAVGNALNGAEIKGFQLDFLAKVPEVKDTVNKNSLVYHICSIVLEKFTDSTDLYSELGAVVRCAKVDFDEIGANLGKIEQDCKSSWDHLKVLAKLDASNTVLKTKIGDFLTDSAQRIMTLTVIHRRVMNRFRKFLLYMGSPPSTIKETKVNSICKTISEFALEYRTCRDKIVQQKKRIQDKRERNKTRGKLIIDTKQWSTVATNGLSVDDASPVDQKRHNDLSVLLKAKTVDDGCNSYPGARLRSKKSMDDLNAGASFPSRHSGPPGLDGHVMGDDEILDGLVKAATINTDNMRERRRTRHFNRKSLNERRTRTLKFNEDDDVDIAKAHALNGDR